MVLRKWMSECAVNVLLSEAVVTLLSQRHTGRREPH